MQAMTRRSRERSPAALAALPIYCRTLLNETSSRPDDTAEAISVPCAAVRSTSAAKRPPSSSRAPRPCRRP